MDSRTHLPRRALTCILALGVCVCAVRCSDSSRDVHPGEARVLDEACKAAGCSTSGNARLTTGPVSDSTGVRIGPGPGQVTIIVPPFSSETYDSFDIEALVSGKGRAVGTLIRPAVGCDGGTSGAAGCTGAPRTFLLESDYRWMTVGGVIGIDAGIVLEKVTFAVEVQDATSSVDIVDVRFTRYQTDRPLGCSVRRVGR